MSTRGQASHQRVPYHKLQDAEGGHAGDPGGFMLTATQDGKVHVEEKNGTAEGKELDSTRELLTLYQILLRTVLFVGVEVSHRRDTSIRRRRDGNMQ